MVENLNYQTSLLKEDDEELRNQMFSVFSEPEDLIDEYEGLVQSDEQVTSSMPLQDMATADIVGGEGDDVLIGQQAPDVSMQEQPVLDTTFQTQNNIEDDLVNSILGGFVTDLEEDESFGSPIEFAAPQTFQEYGEEIVEDTSSYFGTAARMGAYGFLRRGVVGTGEFLAESPIYAARFIAGTLRGIEEAGRFAAGALLSENLEILISRNIYGEEYRNVFDYVDMFDTQSDIDQFVDQYIAGAINAGYDFITDEDGSRLLTVKDEFGNVQKGDYNKFVDYVFKGLEVPVEKQNVLGRVLMTAGELIVPMGVLRTARGKIGETIEDQIKKFTKEKDFVKQELNKGGTYATKGNTYDSRIKTRKDRVLEKTLNRVERKLADLKFEQRHYSAADTAVKAGKNIKDSAAVTFKDVMKSEANMAIAASTAMVSTEVALEELGFEELKPAALLTGIAGGMIGVGGVARGLSSAKYLTLYAIKGITEGGPSAEGAEYYLRYKGYGEESIRQMTDEEKVQIAVSNPKELKIARDIGRAIADLERTDPKKFREIQFAVEATEKLTRRFNRTILEDKEQGLIQGKDFNYISETIPIVLDQVVQIAALSKVRDTLLKNVTTGGFTLQAKKVTTINEIDKMTKLLETQQRQILDSLEALTKRISSAKGTTESNVQSYVRYMNEFVEAYKKDDSFLNREIDRIRNLSDVDVDPLNTPLLTEDINKIFGPDDMNSVAIMNRLQKEGFDEKTLYEEARNLSKINKEEFGEQQSVLLGDSFESIKKQSDANYAEVEDFDVDVDDLFHMNDFSEELINASDSLERYAADLKRGGNRLEGLVRDARRVGLRRVANRYSDEPNNHMAALMDMSIEHNELIDPNYFKNRKDENGRLLSREEAIEKFKDENYRFAASQGSFMAIKRLETELINSDVFKQTTDSMNRDVIEYIGREIVENDVTKRESVIPAFMSFKDLLDIRSRAMSDAFARNKQTGNLSKQHDKRIEAGAFVSTLNNKVSKYMKMYGAEDLGISKDSYAKAVQADKFYSNAIGKTFKQRLGDFVKRQVDDRPTDTGIDSIPSDQLFDLFLEQQDHLKSADMFRRMFTGDFEIDENGVRKFVVRLDENGNPVGEINEEAKQLLLKAVRRQFTNSSGKINGLKDLDDNFLTAFLDDDSGVHLFKGMDAEDVRKFQVWRQQETNYIDKQSQFFVANERMEYRKTLTEAMEELFQDRETVLAKSIFGERVTDNFDSVIKQLFDREASFHAAREPLDFFRAKAFDTSDNTFSVDNYDRMRRNYNVIENADKDLDDRVTLEMLAPPVRKGASAPKSPIQILLETVEDQASPAKQQEIRESLKGLFVEYITRRAYNFRNKQKWAANEGEYAFELARDVDLGEFTRVMKENENTLELLFENDPEQLTRLKDILQLETMFQGKGIEGSKLLDVGIQLKPSSLMSRVYSISRGVISPKYVATEIAIAKAQAEKGNFMLQVLINPAATKTVAESMAISAGIKQAEPIAAEKLRRLAITIFYTQMGEDYPVEIKEASWVKQQLEFVPRTLNKIRQASKRKEMGITEEQDAPYNIEEEVDDLSRYDKFLN
jgi:hypothetical protein